jgi:hypothetical protein
LPILLQLTSFPALFAAPLKYRPSVFISSVCDAVSVWSTLNLKCFNIIWKENSSYLTENLVSITEATPTIPFREIIASETYTYILCYRNSRFSSVKAGDITTVCSGVRLFLLHRIFSEFGDIYYCFQSTISISWWFSCCWVWGILRHLSSGLWRCDLVYYVKGLPGFWIEHCLSSRRRM